MTALSALAFAFAWMVMLLGLAFVGVFVCAWLGTRGAGGGR